MIMKAEKSYHILSELGPRKASNVVRSLEPTSRGFQWASTGLGPAARRADVPVPGQAGRRASGYSPVHLRRGEKPLYCTD